MKFVCDKCQTQYMISDDKVGHKSIKVRCKRCGNMITLRSTSARTEAVATNLSSAARVSQQPDATAVPNGDELGQAFDQLMKDGLDSRQANGADERQTEIVDMHELDRLRAQSGPTTPEREQEKIDHVFDNLGGSPAPSTEQTEAGEDWYAAIDNKQVGPLSLAELKEKLDNRSIDANSLVWRQGMEDWQSLQELPQMRELLGLNVPSRETATPDLTAATAAPENPKASGTGDFSLTALVEKELASVTGIEPADQEHPKKSPGVLSTLVSEEVPPWERDETASEASGEKHETIFQTQHTGFSQVIVKPKYLGGSGSSTRKLLFGSVIAAALVLITSTIVYQLATRSQTNANGSTAPAIGRPKGSAGGENSAAPMINSLKLPIGGVQAAATGKEENKPNLTADDKGLPPTNEANTNSANVGVRASREDSAEKKEPAVKQAETTVEKSPIKVTEVKETKATTSLRDLPKKSEEKIAAAPSKHSAQPVAAKDSHKKPASSQTTSGGTEDSGNLPNTLSNEQIKGVIRGKIDQMKNCVEQQQQRDPSITGTMLVSFIIENNGRVNTINTLSEEHRGTFVATCITYVIKAMKFPRFTGEPIEVPRLPLKLGG